MTMLSGPGKSFKPAQHPHERGYSKRPLPEDALMSLGYLTVLSHDVEWQGFFEFQRFCKLAA